MVTLYYAILIIPTGQDTGPGRCHADEQSVKGINLYRSIWYLPSVLTGVGVAVLWLWVFNNTNGLLNRMLCSLVESDWFDTTRLVWKRCSHIWCTGFCDHGLWGSVEGMLIYLAGLNAIPLQLYEAARIDGAGWWKRFFKNYFTNA